MFIDFITKGVCRVLNLLESMASYILSTVLWRTGRVIYRCQWHLCILKSCDSVNTMRDSYTHILCNFYRVKENKNILARLLNFSKQLIAESISESNGFTEFKIQWVPSISWYLFSYVEIYVIVIYNYYFRFIIRLSKMKVIIMTRSVYSIHQ